jgi:flagellar motor component MotA
MECYLIREGVEQKAELEDILPLLKDREIQNIFRYVDTSNISLSEAFEHKFKISLPQALAHTSGEIKALVFRNMSKRISGWLEKMVEEAESTSKEDNIFEREKLISYIGDFCKHGWLKFPKDIVWKKEGKPMEQSNSLEEFITEQQRKAPERLKEKIDDAYNTGCLNIDTSELPAAAPLFETGLIKELEIYGKFDGSWPSFLEKCHALKSLTLHVSELTEFPLWIHSAVSLQRLSIEHIFALIPDWIGDMQSLTEISISFGDLETIPDSIGNLKNLTELHLNYIGLKNIPDSIGNLENLVKLDLSCSQIENLPDTIVNCTSLEYIDIRCTKIISPPETISSVKTVRQSIELLPKEHSISYRTFCNCYYRLAEVIIRLTKKSRGEGLLSLEDDYKDYSYDFFGRGLRLVIDGTDEEILRNILTLRIEREHDYYRKKLMEITMEGILCIQSSENLSITVFILAALVNIKNNPLDAACKKYFAGDNKAFDNIDLNAAIEPEKEREEIRFLRRAFALSKKSREEGIFSLEKCLDHDGIAARDVFEYGLPFVIDGLAYEEIDKILSALVNHETDPVRKNLSLTKKEAVLMIRAGYRTGFLMERLIAYFDDSIAQNLREEMD